MRTFVVLLSCLVCWTAAGRLGMAQRRLWWLHGSPAVQQQDVGMDKPSQRNIGMGTLNQRQKWLLDMLLQVQKPLVKADLIEMGKILIDDDSMYTESSDEDLQSFLKECRAHNLLGHGDIYSVMNVRHARQMLGLYKFLVLARDWSVFARNVCFARLHTNPVMYLEALTLALRDRIDTQDLVMPAIEEILPQMYIARDVIAAAQDVDWTDLVGVKTTIRPTLLDVLGWRGAGGLWRPWHDWRMRMIGVPKTIPRQSDERNNPVIAAPSVVVSEVRDACLSGDIGLNVFWDGLITENVLQMLTERQRNPISPVEATGDDEIWRRPISGRDVMGAEEIDAISKDNGIRADFEPRRGFKDVSSHRGILDMEDRRKMDMGNSATILGHPDKMEAIRDNNIRSWLISDRRNIDGINAGRAPATDINDERLLHINRRRLQRDDDDLDMSRMGPRQWRQEIGDDMDMDSQNRRDDRHRLGGIAYGRQVVPSVWGIDSSRAGKRDDESAWSRARTVDATSLPVAHIDSDRLVHVNRRRIRHPVDVSGENVWQRNGNERETVDAEIVNAVRANSCRWCYDPIIDGDRLMPRRTNDDPQSVLHSRRVRSIATAVNYSPSGRLLSERHGEILLQNMQQLVARLRLEEIALRLEKSASCTERKNPLMIATNGMVYQQQRWDQPQTESIVHAVVERLKLIVDAAVQRAAPARNHMNVVRIIGDILIGRHELVKDSSVWREFLMQISRDGLFSHDDDIIPSPIGCLRDPVYRTLLRRLVQLVEGYIQSLPAYTVDELIADDLQINDIDVDRLITYAESADTDLVNVIDQQLLRSDVDNVRRLEKKVVTREKRLNHHPFMVTIDITSQHSQRVVVRLFLGPKIEELGRPVQLEQSRNNFILLDAFVKNLQPGTNIFQRSSIDIEGTSRDITTLSAIYRRVMTGQSMRDLVGQNCRLPHRLLLPRGTADGLPMQIMAVVTPVTDMDREIQQTMRADKLCGLGIVGIALDHLPLNFPLDRKIVNPQTLMLPNILIKETVILHDEQ